MSTTNTSAPKPAFHDWLLRQVSRDDAVGDLARDYQNGTELEIHVQAHSPEDLKEILDVHRANDTVLAVAEQAAAEWAAYSR